MISYLYTFYQLLALSRTSQAISTAPIEPLLSVAGGNRTALNTLISPAWVSNSGVRGTSDILWSCILTLTACVYTAIHLNVPPPQEGRWQFLWRKSKWVALALFAPEIVLYCALTQLLQALKLRNELNELRATQQASHNPAERQESALAPSDAPDSHTNDDPSVVGQKHLAPLTQADRAPNEISPIPIPEISALESKDTTEDDGFHLVSGNDAGDEISHQPTQISLPVPSKGNADGRSIPKSPDLEKGMVNTWCQS